MSHYRSLHRRLVWEGGMEVGLVEVEGVAVDHKRLVAVGKAEVVEEVEKRQKLECHLEPTCLLLGCPLFLVPNRL